MFVATGLRTLLAALALDFRRTPKETNNEFVHPADIRHYSVLEKLKAYFYQVLELLKPSLFFPGHFALPLDSFDQDRFFPSTQLLQQARLLDVTSHKPGSDEWQMRMSAEYDVSRSLEFFMWRDSIQEGVTPKKRYIDAFPDSLPTTHDATTWEEVRGNQTDTRTMGAGIFIVGGTLAHTLGIGAQPQHVSHVQLVWQENSLTVTWKMEQETLCSLWPITKNFIFTGVADAGLVETLLSIRETRNDIENRSPPIHTIDVVTTTRKVHDKTLYKWKAATYTLPCINEPCFWSGQAEQWRRRTMLAVERRALYRLRLPFLKPWSYPGDSKIFQGMGAFLAEPTTDFTAEVTPKPALSVAPIVLEKEVRRTGWFDAFRISPRLGVVQKSVTDKWKNRSKPRTLPTWVCDIHNDYLPIKPIPGSDYLAISHRWGQIKDDTLKDEVQRVAKELQVQYAWIDTLCMLNDKDERAAEIAKMGDYYSEASAVVVLLPTVKKQTTYTDLGNGIPFDFHEARRQDAGLAKEIAESEWLTRVWTIQEAQLAQICIVKTQHQILDGEYLDHLLHQPEHCRLAMYAALGHTYPAGSPIINVRGIWNAYELKAYSCTFGSRQWWNASNRTSIVSPPNKTGLPEILKLAEGRNCTEERDFVIGLLGMVNGRIPPLSAQADTWKSLWTKLMQNGIAPVEVLLRSQIASKEHAMCWAPASINKMNPLRLVGMSGEGKVQQFRWVDEGLELLGTPIEVSVGDELEHDGLFSKAKLPGVRRIVLTMGNGHKVKTVAQVMATSGKTFVGIALEPEKGDKGVLVLLGEWTHMSGEVLRFHRRASMNVVKSLQLMEAFGEPQRVVLDLT